MDGSSNLRLRNQVRTEELHKLTKCIRLRQRILGIFVPDALDHFPLDLRDFVLCQSVVLFTAACGPSSQEVPVWSCETQRSRCCGKEVPPTVWDPVVRENKIEEFLSSVAELADDPGLNSKGRIITELAYPHSREVIAGCGK